MNLKGLIDFLDRHGGEAGAWPVEGPGAGQAAKARTLIANSQAAARALETARALDRALKTYDAPPAGELLARRIAEAARREPQPDLEARNPPLPAIWRLPRYLAPQAAGLAAAAMLGFYVGSSYLIPGFDAEPAAAPEDLSDLIFGETAELMEPDQ